MPSAPIPAQPVGHTTYCPVIAVGATAGAYSAGQAVGPLFTITGAASSIGTGVINGATLADAGNQAANVFLVLFSSQPSAIADKSAFTLAKADLNKVIDVISFASANYIAFTNTKVCVVSGHNKSYDLGNGVTTMYGQLFTSGTPTYGAGNVQLIVDLQLD